ncbi:inhibin beta E chain-like [Dendronephthya gigantea]|uniref:inhibin beta E chain-like n=1 Tax=Dendronephthya gigantea TaxID=151771 RepID=UPI001069A7A2|nr:inhibin beta E chain-like [Dendronephthya gigantea]XP_028408785.1 inhibin beta E chain-like [Dendronephthya gigantea]
MSEHRRSTKETALLLLFLAATVFSIDGLCWNCLPNNLSVEEIDKIFAEDFKERLMEKLGLTNEPVVPENVTRPPQEVVDEILSEQDNVVHKKDKEMLQTIVIQPLNNDSVVSNTTSYFEYATDIDRWNRIDHVTLWMHVEANTGVYRVYEKISTSPRRMVIVDEHESDVSQWKKLNFVPNRQWLEKPWGRKIRIEIEGIETPIAHKPLLQLKVKPVIKRHRKRSVVSTTVNPSVKATVTDDCIPKNLGLCCRHTRNIDMSSYYPWIVVPNPFRSFTCSGTCTLRHRTNNTWTLLTQITNVRQPCCVPTSFDTATLLIYDGTSTTYKTKIINDLLVTNCGCT